MKKLTTLLGTGLFAMSGVIAPMTAMAQGLDLGLDPSLADAAPASTVSSGQKMALYNDCLRSHANVNGADFKQVNKFCACIADQSIQGEGSFSSCAGGGGGGGGLLGGGGGTFGMLGEVAPSVISGVVQGITSNSGKKSGGGILSGLSGLLGGGLLGGGGGGLLGGGGLGDLLKGR
jgi:hypothetical protein